MAKCMRCDLVFSVYGSTGEDECPRCNSKVKTPRITDIEVMPETRRCMDCTCDKKEVEDVENQIRHLMHMYYVSMKREPNHIILGIDKYQKLRTLAQIDVMVSEDHRKEFMGMPISVDYDQPQLIKVGWLIE